MDIPEDFDLENFEDEEPGGEPEELLEALGAVWTHKHGFFCKNDVFYKSYRSLNVNAAYNMLHNVSLSILYRILYRKRPFWLISGWFPVKIWVSNDVIILFYDYKKSNSYNYTDLGYFRSNSGTFPVCFWSINHEGSDCSKVTLLGAEFRWFSTTSGLYFR